MTQPRGSIDHRPAASKQSAPPLSPIDWSLFAACSYLHCTRRPTQSLLFLTLRRRRRRSRGLALWGRGEMFYLSSCSEQAYARARAGDEDEPR